MSDTQDNSRELRGRWPGLYAAQFNVVVESWFDRFHSSREPNENNDWLFKAKARAAELHRLGRP